MERCAGCNEPRDRAALRWRGRAGGPCCKACFRHGRRWRRCTHHPAEPECECVERSSCWLCLACLRVDTLERGVDSRTSVLPVSRLPKGDATALHTAGLHESSLALGLLADVWLLSLSEECYLILGRVVLWVRHGCLAGLVLGVAATTWSNGARVLDLLAIATHLAGLWGAGSWPAGAAPILVTTASPAQVAALQASLAPALPAAELARLRPAPCLSEQRATARLNTAAFVRAPGRAAWARVKLVERAQAAAAAAGLPLVAAHRLGETSARAHAFRMALYPPRV